MPFLGMSGHILRIDRKIGQLICHDRDRDHDHTIPHLNLPAGFVVDHTDKGVLWDPTLSAYSYSYDAATQSFTPYNTDTPVKWLEFNGQWGDAQLPGGPGIFGQYKYTDGPNGPKFKDLVRTKVCPSDPCVILPVRTWKRAQDSPS
jgi:hypothetical protein